MKESAQTTNSMENSQIQSSTIRPKKKAMTLVADPTALNRFSSFDKLLGRQLSTNIALNLKANLSTEDSEALISQSKMKTETATNSPAKKIKKKIRKVVEIQLGPQTRVLIEKVIEEETPKEIPKVSEEKIEEELKKIVENKKSANFRMKETRNKSINIVHTWSDITRSQITPNLKEIKTYQNLEHIENNYKNNHNHNEISNIELVKEEKTPAQKISIVEASPIETGKSSLLRRRKTNTTLLPSIIKLKRKKNYKIKQIPNVNLFEGLPYIGYENYVKKDSNMQKVIIKDLLKVLFEKTVTLKNSLADRYRIHQVFNSTAAKNLDEFNKKIEETIALMLGISMIILQEFQDQPERIGISTKPRERTEDEINVFNESDALQDNLKFYGECCDFLKDSIDTYMIIRRQKDREILADYSVNTLIKYISKCRYNLGEMNEDYLIFEKNYIDKRKRGDAPLSPMRKFKSKKRTMNLTPREAETKKEMDKIKEKKQDFAKKIQVLNTLLQNKFNLHKLKFQTREAKVNLNQEDFEIQKALLILEDIKNIKFPVANNLKKIQMERMKNPFSKADDIVGFARNLITEFQDKGL